MKRAARLSSARHWLVSQKNRTPVQIAKSYRKRYGVDWPCAIREIALLGVSIDADWVQQLSRSLHGNHRARAKRKALREFNPPLEGDEFNETWELLE